MTTQRYPADDRRARTRRTLTNAEALEAVVRFLRTGNARHLPPALRPEAEGILATVVRAMAGPPLPWPSGTAQPDPGPGATFAALLRALVGDERADADSGLLDDDDPEAAP
jgi:hypothetical protein